MNTEERKPANPTTAQVRAAEAARYHALNLDGRSHSARRWFSVRGVRVRGRCIVDMHTADGRDRAGGEYVEVEPVARYWSARKAVGLARVLNVLARNGVRSL